MTTLPLSVRPVRVAVLCEDDRVRSGLRQLLASRSGTVTVGSDTGGVDAAVVDVRPGQAVDPGWLRELLGRHPVVVLGYDDATARAARAAGAAYLDKAEVADRLSATVHDLVQRHGTDDPEQLDRGRAGALAITTLAMFVGPWAWWVSRIAETHGLIDRHLPQGLALWTIPPLLAAAVLATGGRPGLIDLGRRMVHWRVPGRIWLGALLTPAAIAGVAAAVVGSLGGHVPVGESISLPGALIYLGYGTGLFLLTEEAGWRGVLLPQLQTRTSPLWASLVLGVVWAVWHLPLLVSRDGSDRRLLLVPFSLLVVATSVLIAALFNAAHGSVLVVAWGHAAFDATYSYLGVAGSDPAMLWAAVAVTGSAATVLAIASRGRLLLAEPAVATTSKPSSPTEQPHRHECHPEADLTTTETRARTLAREEGEIAYELHGDGPLVVCVPGMGELRSSYRHNTRSLMERGLRVATMDLRGHGGSSTTFDSFDDVAAATDVVALVEELGGPAVVVGSSMGAGAAVWAAAERPDLVAGLVLVGPFVRDAPMNPLLAWAFRLAMSGPWAATVWKAYQPSLYPLRKPADFAEHRAAIRASMRRPGYARTFTATTRTSHAPVAARISEVRAPALVVMGTGDPDFADPEAEADWIVEHLPQAERLLVDGAGHYPHAEAPEIVNPVLVGFVEQTLRGLTPCPGPRTPRAPR